MKQDKRAKRSKQKTKAANVARQREKDGDKFYGVEIEKQFFTDLFQFLHDQNRPDCDEILQGLHTTMQVIGSTNVFEPKWIKRAVKKRNELGG